MDTVEKPQPPASGLIYGGTVYWLTYAGSIITVIGSVLCFTTTSNYIDPSNLISAMWEGKSASDIWMSSIGALPNGHWYIPHILKGDGLTEFGLAVGVFSVTPACILAGFALFKEKLVGYGIMALIAGAFTIISMLGLI